jgi:hypothetical protein
MICIIALPVLAVLGLFSASHRELAREAYECVFRTATFQPCKVDFDQKIKGKVVGRLLTISPPLARFVHRHFVLLSWLLFIATVLSLIGSLWGLYNLWAYGNCNGPNSSEFCVLTGSRGLITLEEFNRTGSNYSDALLYTPCNATDLPYTSARRG